MFAVGRGSDTDYVDIAGAVRGDGEKHAVFERVHFGQTHLGVAAESEIAGRIVEPLDHARSNADGVGVGFGPCGGAFSGGASDVSADPALVEGKPDGGEIEIAFGGGASFAG